jgi:hypothetical protein
MRGVCPQLSNPSPYGQSGSRLSGIYYPSLDKGKRKRSLLLIAYAFELKQRVHSLLFAAHLLKKNHSALIISFEVIVFENSIP